jgi:hypothetical protein
LEGGFMADKKVVFIAFASEDARQRDFLMGQSLLTKRPFEYIDPPVEEPDDPAWMERVRSCVRSSDGVIALVSRHSLTSSRQQWEITCATEEGKKILGIWVYTNDRTVLPGVNSVVWTWGDIRDFVDGL